MASLPQLTLLLALLGGVPVLAGAADERIRVTKVTPGDVFVYKNPPLVLEFEAENLTSRTINLLELIPSCSCLKPVETSATLQAGEKRRLTVHVESDNAAGPQNHYLEVPTDDPLTSELRIPVEFLLLRPHSLAPASLTATLNADNVLTTAVAVLSLNENAEVVSVFCASERLRLNVGATAAAPAEPWKKQIPLQVTADGRQSTQTIESQATVVVKDGETTSVLTLPMTFSVARTYRCVPESLPLGRVRSGARIARSFQITDAAGQGARVRQVRFAPRTRGSEKFLTAAVSSERPDTVTLTGTVPPPGFGVSGQIVVDLDTDPPSTVVAPVSGFVERAR